MAPQDSTTLPFDPNFTSFPSRQEVAALRATSPTSPRGAAWVWGATDNLGRLNLLTPTRITSAARLITSGVVVPLNLPLTVPATPAFGRQPSKHTITALNPGLAYDDIYELNNQLGSQWDGFRHCAHAASGMFTMGYDPFQHHVISWEDLRKCGESQGVDIRPKSQGGNVEVGDLLSIRSGWCAAYARKSVKEREEAALRVHAFGPDDGQRWAGVKQEEKMIDWLHDCWFAAFAGDAPSFEAWPSLEGFYLHEYLLSLWGTPIGEMFDLERLAETYREKKRRTFFVSSQPANVPGGVGSHPNATATF